MRNPGFGVVTFVVTVLAVFGVAARALRPFVPAVAENAMDREKEPFLREGRLQPIPWQRWTPAALEKARRTDRPVLLFVGMTTSRVARNFDESVTDPDVARLLARRFVCVRVDGLEHPEWVNAFLPLTRFKLGFQPDAQIWILDPAGRPFFFLGRTTTDSLPRDTALLNSLRQALDRFRELRRQGDATVAGEVQRADLSLLSSAPKEGWVDLEQYRQALRNAVDPKAGGFPVGGLRLPRPLAHRFLLSVGDLATAREALDPLLQSPQRDLVSGGMFHVTMGSGPWYVEFDKWTMEIAEMAQTLAMAYCLLGDASYREAAVDCLDAIAHSLAGERFLTAGEIGATDPRDRSERHSFPPRRLADSLSREDTDWAVSNLGLDLIRNPQAVPYLANGEAGDDLSEVLVRMRILQPKAKLAREGYADVHLGTLARSIQAARLLGDDRRLRLLSRRLDESWAFFMTRSGYVRRVAETESQVPGLLGDHLAYADAKLQDYLATGHYTAFQDGLRILNRAVGRFRREPGAFLVAPPGQTGLPTVAIPELADNLKESTTAQAGRLLLTYGRLLTDRPEGAALLKDAYAAVYRYGDLAIGGGPMAAGFYGAAAEATDDGYAICTGPDAQRLADLLARRCPTRLVAPAVGDVRRDLSARGPGIYVIRGKAQGPLSLKEALYLLPATLEPPR
ncbi:MAG: DUF255 domain-containing protein [Fimbriimonas sp.]